MEDWNCHINMEEFRYIHVESRYPQDCFAALIRNVIQNLI